MKPGPAAAALPMGAAGRIRSGARGCGDRLGGRRGFGRCVSPPEGSPAVPAPPAAGFSQGMMVVMKMVMMVCASVPSTREAMAGGCTWTGILVRIKEQESLLLRY